MENELDNKSVITEFLNSKAIAQFVQSKCKDVINLVDYDNAQHNSFKKKKKNMNSWRSLAGL